MRFSWILKTRVFLKPKLARGPALMWHRLRWLGSALVCVVLVRLGLTVIRYKRLAKLLPAKGSASPPLSVQRWCRWAVTRTSRVVPKASCLTQALAGLWLLRLMGFEASVVIGVAAGEMGSAAVRAHAWLESGPDVILGGDDESLSDFQRLTVLGRS